MSKTNTPVYDQLVADLSYDPCPMTEVVVTDELIQKFLVTEEELDYG